MSKSMRRKRQSERAKARSAELPFDVTRVSDDDFGVFRQLYGVLATFAEAPKNAINRIGRGKISIPDDQANELEHWLSYVLQQYPGAAKLELIKLAIQFDAIFTRKSAGGEAFDEWFWTNTGFERHLEWEEIRAAARKFLVR